MKLFNYFIISLLKIPHTETILQRQIERMEERNARLEAELFNVKADSFGLKTRLEGEISNVKAENMELKMRLTQGEKQILNFLLQL